MLESLISFLEAAWPLLALLFPRPRQNLAGIGRAVLQADPAAAFRHALAIPGLLHSPARPTEAPRRPAR